MEQAAIERLSRAIRDVPDFPKKGIIFKDITTLLQDRELFKKAIDIWAARYRDEKIDVVAAIESRGFIFGAVLADRLKVGLIPARKPGKLPYKTISEKYDLEYGTDSLEIHSDAINGGDRVVIVDDLIATGGTLKAVCSMVERLGGTVAGISVVIDLSFLPWRERLKGYDVNCLISYDSE